MNIPNLIAAMELLDASLIFTIKEEDRKEVIECADKIDRLLRKYGVFIGRQEQKKDQNHEH